MSHYNNHQGGHYNNNNNNDDEEYDDGYNSQSYPMQQHLTPQQQRQEARRRHAEQSSASATAAAAAAGKGSSPWLSKQKKKSSKCKTIAWAVLALLLIAIAGVLAWYFAVFKKNQNKSSDNSVGGKVPAIGPTGKLYSPGFSMFFLMYLRTAQSLVKSIARWGSISPSLPSPPYPVTFSLTLNNNNNHDNREKKEASKDSRSSPI